MARSAIRRMHDVAPRQGLDRAILIIAFLAGTGGSLALKLLGVHPFVASAYAAIILVLYATLTYATTSLRLEPETIGDNCYYLGFLFTLTSLAVTLYFVVEANAETQAELIPDVISGFGVALSSTIVGVALRVLMMQFRVDLVAREKDTRLELNMASRELRQEMARGLQQVKSFTTECLQHVREREEAFCKITDEMARDAQQKIERYSTAIQTGIEASFREQTEKAVQGISEIVEKASGEILKSIAETSTDLKDNAKAIRREKQQAIAEMESYREAVSQAYKQLADQSRSLADEVRSVAEAGAASLSEVSAQSRSAVEDGKAAREQLSASVRQFNDTVRRIGATTETAFRTAGGRLSSAASEAMEEIRLTSERACETITQQAATAASGAALSTAAAATSGGPVAVAIEEPVQ